MISTEAKLRQDRIEQLAKAISDAIKCDVIPIDKVISYCDELKRRLSQKKKRGE